MDVRVGHKKAERKRIDAFELMVLEKTLESPFDCKEIQPVHPKENQSWIFIGRTDAEAETPILGPCDVKNWLIWKDPDAGKDWRQEEKMTGWDGWMSLPTRRTWVWVNSGSWWWTARPGVLQSMGSQSPIRLRSWTEEKTSAILLFIFCMFCNYYVLYISSIITFFFAWFVCS